MNPPRLFQRFYLLILACLLLYLVLGMSIRHGLPSLGMRDGTTVLIGLAMLISIGAYPLARRMSTRLDQLRCAVEAFGEGELERRAPVHGQDEIAAVALGFNRAADRIEHLVNAHRALLANASHELRTPLARIRLGLELLAERDDPTRRNELIGDMLELDDLLEEILLSSRLDATLPLQPDAEVDVLGLLAEEATRYPDLHIEFLPPAAGAALPLICADSRLLRRMLRNLLENARRHGAAPVRVDCRAQSQGIEVLIEDSGSGIVDTDYDRVFEPFYRSRAHLENVGSGLGLALVKQIVERHAGQVSCERSELGGARFRVCLPKACG